MENEELLNYSKVADFAYSPFEKELVPDGYLVVGATQTTSGFGGVALFNQSSGELVVGYAGTNLRIDSMLQIVDSTLDLASDVLVVGSGFPVSNQRIDALGFLEAAAASAHEDGLTITSVTIVGHSLGGYLTSLVESQISDFRSLGFDSAAMDGLAVRAITFNSAGVGGLLGGAVEAAFGYFGYSLRTNEGPNIHVVSEDIGLSLNDLVVNTGVIADGKIIVIAGAVGHGLLNLQNAMQGIFDQLGTVASHSFDHLGAIRRIASADPDSPEADYVHAILDGDDKDASHAIVVIHGAPYADSIIRSNAGYEGSDDGNVDIALGYQGIGEPGQPEKSYYGGGGHDSGQQNGNVSGLTSGGSGLSTETTVTTYVNDGNNPGNPNAAGYYESPPRTDDFGRTDDDPKFTGPQPILLDINGNGIEISELHESSVYRSGEDGLQHLSAWAGAGDGVLFYDADGDGKISDRREYVFTDWAPGAGDDMEALRQAFDANGKMGSPMCQNIDPFAQPAKAPSNFRLYFHLGLMKFGDLPERPCATECRRVESQTTIELDIDLVQAMEGGRESAITVNRISSGWIDR